MSADSISTNVLFLDPLKCNGCKECETACSIAHTGKSDPLISRIQIISENDGEEFYLPMTCQHCEDAPCLAVCPKEAIYQDERVKGVMIHRELCVGCQMCVSACPTGAMRFDENRGLVYKCDLCGGDPECVRVCEPKALLYMDGQQLNRPRLRESADKYYKILRHMTG